GRAGITTSATFTNQRWTCCADWASYTTPTRTSLQPFRNSIQTCRPICRSRSRSMSTRWKRWSWSVCWRKIRRGGWSADGTIYRHRKLHIIRTWHRATFFCAAQLRDGGKQWKTIFKTLLNGLLIGISVAAPVGAMGVLIIRRTLAYGAPAGFVSGLGVATADASYALIAAFGLTFISNALIDA